MRFKIFECVDFLSVEVNIYKYYYFINLKCFNCLFFLTWERGYKDIDFSNVKFVSFFVL